MSMVSKENLSSQFPILNELVSSLFKQSRDVNSSTWIVSYMCVHACMQVCMEACVFVHTHMCMHISRIMCLCAHEHGCVYACMCVRAS